VSNASTAARASARAAVVGRGRSVGVVNDESGAALVFNEINGRARQMGRRVRIDQHLEVAVLDHGVSITLFVEGEAV